MQGTRVRHTTRASSGITDLNTGEEGQCVAYKVSCHTVELPLLRNRAQRVGRRW
jgi:hypothetical protein